MNTYFPSTGTMKNHILNLLWIIPEGCIQIEMISLRQSHKNGVSKTGRICRRLPSHHRNRSLGNAQWRIRNHQFRWKFHLIPQTMTHRTCTKRIIKWKASRFNLLKTDPTVRAGKALTESHRFFLIRQIHNCQSLGQFQRCLERICQTLLDTFPYHQSVYNNGNIVLLILLKLNLFRQFILMAIHHHTHIPTLPCLIKNLHMLAFSAPDNRCQQLDLRPLR